MALAVEFSGTLTATINTPATLAAPTTNKTRVLRVDCGNMIAGDIIEIRIQTTVLAAGTIRDQHRLTYAHTLGAPIVESVPISSNNGATFILTQTAGSAGRQFPWCVLTLD